MTPLEKAQAAIEAWAKTQPKKPARYWIEKAAQSKLIKRKYNRFNECK